MMILNMITLHLFISVHYILCCDNFYVVNMFLNIGPQYKLVVLCN